MFGSHHLVKVDSDTAVIAGGKRGRRARAGPALEPLRFRARHALTVSTNSQRPALLGQPTAIKSTVLKPLIRDVPRIVFNLGRVCIHSQIAIPVQPEERQCGAKSGSGEQVESCGGLVRSEIAKIRCPHFRRSSGIGEAYFHHEGEAIVGVRITEKGNACQWTLARVGDGVQVLYFVVVVAQRVVGQRDGQRGIESKAASFHCESDQISVAPEFDPYDALVSSVGRPDEAAVGVEERQISVGCEIESASLWDWAVSIGCPDDSHGLGFVGVAHANAQGVGVGCGVEEKHLKNGIRQSYHWHRSVVGIVFYDVVTHFSFIHVGKGSLGICLDYCKYQNKEHCLGIHGYRGMNLEYKVRGMDLYFMVRWKRWDLDDGHPK
ncbi:hypothetical protein SUGI_0224030 [Cryptomeria japonica]|nr:hypothetical protein SUGI_0224030 [Cryptomeria japonica]